MNWININLPWSYRPTEAETAERMAESAAVLAAIAKIREQFGPPLVSTADFNIPQDDLVQRAPELSRGDVPFNEAFSDEWLASVVAKYADDPQVVLLARHRNRVRKEREIENSLPECVAYQGKYETQRQADRNREFRSHPLCIPGVLIEVATIDEDGVKGDNSTYLIGDINPLGGLCDDCSITGCVVLKALDLRTMVPEIFLKEPKTS